MLSFLAVASVA